MAKRCPGAKHPDRSENVQKSTIWRFGKTVVKNCLHVADGEETVWENLIGTMRDKEEEWEPFMWKS
jgi:hypothetical protein